MTLGGGERAVEAYAEGKGAGGVALEAAKGVGETVLPINEIETLADPSKNAWEKAEAFATGTAKVAGLAAGGLAAKNAIAQRLADKPGIVTESAAGAEAATGSGGRSAAARNPQRDGPTPSASDCPMGASRAEGLDRAQNGPNLRQRAARRTYAERGLVELCERRSDGRAEAASTKRDFKSRWQTPTVDPGTSPQSHFRRENATATRR